MNPIYRNVRFWAQLPHGKAPESFGVLTAWNPHGIPTAASLNAAANAELQATLTAAGFLHFPVTGGASDGSYHEIGFGVVASQTQCLELGRLFRQEAIYYVSHGQVELVSCGTEAPEQLATWQEMVIEASDDSSFPRPQTVPVDSGTVP